MKIKPASIISIAIAFVSLVLLVSFRTVPVSRLWKDYEIFYVYSNELSESDISYILEKNGCKNVVFRGNQRYPLVSPVAPVQPQAQDSYIYSRNGFFTDKTNSAYVFYVPDGQEKNLEKAVIEISSFQGSSCGTDGKNAFPWIAPLVSFAFALILLCFSHEKKLFAFSAFFPVLLAFCRPLYTVAAASIFLLFAFFMMQKIWQRRNFKKTFLNSPYVLVFSLSPFLLLIFSSIINAIFYVLALAASVCAVKIYKDAESYKNEKYDFKPVMIMSSKMIPLVGHNGIRLMGFMALVLVALGAAFVFLGRVSVSGNDSSNPELPSPVSDSNSSLPNFDDFLGWSWNTITFPYRKLSQSSKKPAEGDFVSIPDYTESNGFISENDSQFYVYDSKFKSSVENQIENLDYPALEKMMIRQGKNSFYGYSKGKLSSPERFGGILLFSFVLISAVFSGYYIVGRKRYGLSI